MSTDPKRDRSGAKGMKTSTSRARVWMAIQAWVIFGARHVPSLNRHLSPGWFQCLYDARSLHLSAQTPEPSNCRRFGQNDTPLRGPSGAPQGGIIRARTFEAGPVQEKCEGVSSYGL